MLAKSLPIVCCKTLARSSAAQVVDSAALSHLTNAVMLPAISDHQGVGDADRLGGDHDGEKVLLVGIPWLSAFTSRGLSSQH